MARDTILFDINETVLDLSALRGWFETAFKDPSIATVWFANLLQSSAVCALTDVKTGFAELAGIALDTVAARKEVSLSEKQRNDILSGFASLPAHPDIVPALEVLKSNGYRTVAFSNSSQNLVTNQIANAGLNNLFDEILSVESTGTFKPDQRAYRFAIKRLERAPRDLRLIATHDWDTHGAMTAGMRAAFIDRMGAPYHPLYKKPDVMAKDMRDVVQLIVEKDKTEGS